MALVCITAETTYVWQLLNEMGAIQMKDIAIHLIPPISSPPLKFSASSFAELLQHQTAATLKQPRETATLSLSKKKSPNNQTPLPPPTKLTQKHKIPQNKPN